MTPKHYEPILDFYSWQWLKAKYEGRKADAQRYDRLYGEAHGKWLASKGEEDGGGCPTISGR
jgi:hypothetical protein